MVNVRLRSFLVSVAPRMLTIDKEHSFTSYKILACFLYYAVAKNRFAVSTES